MKNLSTAGMMLGASLAAGCDGAEGRIDVGHDLNADISPAECYNDITNGVISLRDQEEVVVNPHDDDAYITSDGEFNDKLRAVKEELINNLVVLAAIGNLDGYSSTSGVASTVTGTIEEDFGNGSIETESTDLYAKVDFGRTTSLSDVQIDMAVTDPTCTKLYSDVFHYDVENQQGQNDEEPFYVVSEE